jgi:dihydroorotate dehydrogenase
MIEVPYRMVWPVLRALDPETAHRLTVKALRSGLVPTPRLAEDDAALRVAIWGRTLPNPVGLAAGFDKNAEVCDAMLAHGFGFVEAGTVTRRPQSGNPPPRVFRLERDRALINRLGFNNEGLDVVARRLAERRRRGRPGCVGVNIGPNRDSADPIHDCAAMMKALANLADYLVVNVSSPNTPGLRDLQQEAALRALLAAVLGARAETGAKIPVLVKIAPDLGADALESIADVAASAGVDGLIATNTTIARPEALTDPRGREAGGLSGAPLFARSTAILAALYRLTQGRIPIVGVGGISSGADAYAKICAGATVVQLYTALVYQGPALVARIKRDLLACLRADGFNTISEAVGSGAAATGRFGAGSGAR